MQGEASDIDIMDNDKQGKHKLIISEDEKQFPHKRTTKARSSLHRLIVRFRKNAENADDIGGKTIFRFAAEVLSGLARSFKNYEQNIDEQSHTK